MHTHKNRRKTVRLKSFCPLSYEEVGMASRPIYPYAISSFLGKEDLGEEPKPVVIKL